MLQTCSSVMLLTTDSDLIKEYESLARVCEVDLRTEESWSTAYRITADRIVTTSDHLAEIGESYFENVVLILGDEETFIPYREKISFFIFDKTDARELMFAFLKPVKEFSKQTSSDVKDIVSNSNVTKFCNKDYHFDFARGEFLYKGRRIYVSRAQQTYLAEWLLNGSKDNKRRMLLCSMRKKFGKEFLADIDRFGNVRKDKDEI